MIAFRWFFPRHFHRSPQRRWLQPYFDSSADYWTFWSIIFLSMGPFLENHAGLCVNKQSEEHNLQTVSGSTACKKKLVPQWRFATLFCTKEVLIFLEIVRFIWKFMDSKNQGLDSYSIEQVSEIKVLFLSLLHNKMNHDRDDECRSLIEIYRFR